jgi:hypothetical protein
MRFDKTFMIPPMPARAMTSRGMTRACYFRDQDFEKIALRSKSKSSAASWVAIRDSSALAV